MVTHNSYSPTEFKALRVCELPNEITHFDLFLEEGAIVSTIGRDKANKEVLAGLVKCFEFHRSWTPPGTRRRYKKRQRCCSTWDACPEQ